jgi:hypothetical protein
MHVDVVTDLLERERELAAIAAALAGARRARPF